jgi:voltage-gated potassium channel
VRTESFSDLVRAIVFAWGPRPHSERQPPLAPQHAFTAAFDYKIGELQSGTGGVVDNRQLRRERWVLLHNIIRTGEPVMACLAGVWMVLLVIDFTRGLTPALTTVSRVIWLVFALDFLAELTVAPDKTRYLKRHWLVAVSLVLPILRIARLARLARIARAARGARLVRAIGSFNRGMAALRATMRRRGIGYVAALTALTTIAGAAAMYAFEHDVADPAGIHGFGTALWWTAMIMTTMGSAYWPQTVEGRIVCVLLALYAFAMFGYVTATLSSFFIDRDASRDDAALAGQRSLDALASQIAALRALVETQSQRR